MLTIGSLSWEQQYVNLTDIAEWTEILVLRNIFKHSSNFFLANESDHRYLLLEIPETTNILDQIHWVRYSFDVFLA